MSGMTIKEIADIANVDRSTIIRWTAKVDGAIRTEIDAKCTEAETTKKPATFTLDEAVSIVRAGGNATLADLLAENARQKEVVEAQVHRSIFNEVFGGPEPLNLEHAIIAMREIRNSPLSDSDQVKAYRKVFGIEPRRRFPSALPRTAGLLGDGKGGKA